MAIHLQDDIIEAIGEAGFITRKEVEVLRNEIVSLTESIEATLEQAGTAEQ